MKIYAMDQSLTGFAHCLLEDGDPKLLETINTKNMDGWLRIQAIVDRVLGVIREFKPDVIVMEDYAFTARTNTITQIAELCGIIKYEVFKLGFEETREALKRGTNAFVVQTVSQMKKFNLGNGAMKKDSRYLLEVFQRIKQSFVDDNQADAYMHAWLCSIIVGVIQGKVPVGNLTSYQQEALMSCGVKKQKGLSLAKALKLPDDQKLRYVGW